MCCMRRACDAPPSIMGTYGPRNSFPRSCMPADYLHNHSQFADLLRIVAQEKGIDPALVEKDYWIMHGLYGLQQLNLKFELKGGASLAKGNQMIHRFSEAIET